MNVSRAVARLRPFTPHIAILIATIGLAWTFAAAVVAHAREFGLPLEDAYIYLTYAKQFGRGEPFTYFPGGDYSAGSTSVLWPMVLAPFWTLGARGHALVWVSFGLSTVLFAATCIGCYRLAREIAGQIAGLVAAAVTIAIAPFVWTALAGMEVAFASWLLVSTFILLARAPREGPPSKLLGICLAATSLSRPEATMIVGAIIGVTVIGRLRRRQWRAAAWWCAPLLAPLAWVTANKLLAGNWFPNTGVAKSHFYLPGFDWSYWWQAVSTQTGRMMKTLFWSDASPLVWPRLLGVLWILGAVRVLWWAAQQRRWLVGVVLVASPFVLVMAVIASSGAWAFHNYRYIAPAFPLFAITAACAIAPVKLAGVLGPARRRGLVEAASGVLLIVLGLVVLSPMFPKARGAGPVVMVYGPVVIGLALAGVGIVRLSRGTGGPVEPRGAAAAWALAASVFVALYWRAALAPMRSDIMLFAQNVVDLNRQVVTLGRHIHKKLPDASIMFHDAGAIAYYGDTRVYDMLGLVTNRQAHVANHGPGARFEFLESLPPERRPTHFAYYPAWMGQGEFFGEVLLATPLDRPFSKRRLIGDHDMQLIVAVWDHVHTAERPLVEIPGWRMVDRVDVADLVDERAHGWRGALGRRKMADPTAVWSLVHRETGATGLLIDGGRTIRGGHEQFTIAIDPSKPVKLVLRSGGRRQYPWHEEITDAVAIEVSTGAGTVAATIPPPMFSFAEIAIDLPVPAGKQEVTVRVRAASPYRVFHWFALQPDPE